MPASGADPSVDAQEPWGSATKALDAFTSSTKGLVPAPAAGDAAAGKYLHADGTWKAPASAGAVRYDASQSLSAGEQGQAQANIGIPAIIKNTNGGWLAKAGGVRSGYQTKSIGAAWGQILWGSITYDYFPIYTSDVRCFVRESVGGPLNGNMVIGASGIYNFRAQIYLAPPSGGANLSVYLGLFDLGTDGNGADGGNTAAPVHAANQHIVTGMHPSLSIDADVPITIPAGKNSRYIAFKWHVLDAASIATSATLQTDPLYCWANVERKMLL